MNNCQNTNELFVFVIFCSLTYFVGGRTAERFPRSLVRPEVRVHRISRRRRVQARFRQPHQELHQEKLRPKGRLGN